MTYLLRNLYAGQEATVRTGHGTTDWFKIGKGVHQGCALSPFLFNLYAEYRASLVAQSVKKLPVVQEMGFNPWVRKIPWRSKRLPTPVFWHGEFHGLYSLQRVRHDWVTFTFHSAYKLNKQGDNIQPWCTPFRILNQSVVPCPVLTVASWPADIKFSSIFRFHAG